MRDKQRQFHHLLCGLRNPKRTKLSYQRDQETLSERKKNRVKQERERESIISFCRLINQKEENFIKKQRDFN